MEDKAMSETPATYNTGQPAPDPADALTAELLSKLDKQRRYHGLGDLPSTAQEARADLLPIIDTLLQQHQADQARIGELERERDALRGTVNDASTLLGKFKKDRDQLHLANTQLRQALREAGEVLRAGEWDMGGHCPVCWANSCELDPEDVKHQPGCSLVATLAQIETHTATDSAAINN